MLISSILAALAATTECVVRYLKIAPEPNTESRNLVTDPHVPWRRKPNSRITATIADGETFLYRYNSQGFRDVEHPLEKPAETFRIIALGDSFTHGSAANDEDTYPDQLESISNRAHGGSPRIEVINMGIPRYWPEAERLLLQHYGLRYDPDLVVIGFVFNDLSDTMRGVRHLTVSNGFLIHRGGGILSAPLTWLYQHSHALRLPISWYFKRVADKQPRLTLEQAWERIFDEYREMIRLAKARDPAVPVVIFNLSPKAWSRSGRLEYQRRLEEFCAAHDCFYLDIADDLAKVEDPSTLYWPLDGHYNADGYRVAASALLRFIEQSGFVGQERNRAPSAN